LEHQINQSKRNFFQKIRMVLPDGICRLKLKSKILNKHQNNQSKRTFSQKKVCVVPLSTLSVKEPKIRLGGDLPEFATEASKTIELKLSSKNLNLISRSV
jgi:hypothetical protein